MIQQFMFEDTALTGLKLITPFFAADQRGSFLKDYSDAVFQKNGIECGLKEVLYVASEKGVLRGLHFQREKQQPKLLRCISGEVFCVAVDLRCDSKTYKQWLSFQLSAENMLQLYVPAGFAQGCYSMDTSLLVIKCGEDFHPQFDDGILWNDESLKVVWPDAINERLILSEKDRNLPSFQAFSSRYGGL